MGEIRVNEDSDIKSARSGDRGCKEGKRRYERGAPGTNVEADYVRGDKALDDDERKQFLLD